MHAGQATDGDNAERVAEDFGADQACEHDGHDGDDHGDGAGAGGPEVVERTDEQDGKRSQDGFKRKA